MSNENIQVTVSGIEPVASGKDWFAIDETGTFTIDRDIVATIWLVGGGCNGEHGTWTEDTFTATGGKGGDSGYVSTLSNIKITKNSDCNAVIAEVDDKSGTTLEIDGNLLSCDRAGHTSTIGGSGSYIVGDGIGSTYKDIKEPTNGQTGVATPYQVVGSSGGGAMACDGHNHRTKQGSGGTGAGTGGGHRENGTNAINHGCGGGGGDGCGAVQTGHDGGTGTKGCIIVSYTVIEEPPTLIVQKHYKRVCNTHRTCSTDYYSNNSRKTCCGGCGCGSSNSAYASDYTDTIHIGSGKVK